MEYEDATPAAHRLFVVVDYISLQFRIFEEDWSSWNAALTGSDSCCEKCQETNKTAKKTSMLDIRKF